jgi:hypothetical protein
MFCGRSWVRLPQRSHNWRHGRHPVARYMDNAPQQRYIAMNTSEKHATVKRMAVLATAVHSTWGFVEKETVAELAAMHRAVSCTMCSPVPVRNRQLMLLTPEQRTKGLQGASWSNGVNAPLCLGTDGLVSTALACLPERRSSAQWSVAAGILLSCHLFHLLLHGRLVSAACLQRCVSGSSWLHGKTGTAGDLA